MASWAPYGKIAVPATTATPLFASGWQSIRSVTIQNLDTNALYWGFDSTVTDTTGQKLAAGASVTIDLPQQQSDVGPMIYVYSVAGQTSPADTRYAATR